MKAVSLPWVAVALVTTIAAGYLLRFHAPLPAHTRDALGGAAYVLAVSLGLLALFPRLTARTAAALGLSITCAVEFSQLVSLPWIDAIRGTHLGRLMLGTTFAWSDFGPYSAGGLLAWGIARSLPRRAH